AQKPFHEVLLTSKLEVNELRGTECPGQDNKNGQPRISCPPHRLRPPSDGESVRLPALKPFDCEQSTDRRQKGITQRPVVHPDQTQEVAFQLPAFSRQTVQNSQAVAQV